MEEAKSISEIKEQLKRVPESVETHKQLHDLETKRADRLGVPYRAGVKHILDRMIKRIRKQQEKQPKKDSRSKKHGGNGRSGRKDLRNTIHGGKGRNDREDLRNNTHGANGRKDDEDTGSSQIGLADLGKWWWQHAGEAAVLASCCASHEAALHTFWTEEEWLVHMEEAATGQCAQKQSLTLTLTLSLTLFHSIAMVNVQIIVRDIWGEGHLG